MQAGKAAALGLLGKKCEFALNPKVMIPSWTEAGARLLVGRFLKRYISIGNLRCVPKRINIHVLSNDISHFNFVLA